MASVTDSFDMPIMHQDLRDLSLGRIGVPFGGGYMGYPNMLGGIQMRPLLNNDMVQIQAKKSKGAMNTLKIAGLAIISLVTAGALKGKYNSWQKPNWLLKLLGKVPTPPTP